MDYQRHGHGLYPVAHAEAAEHKRGVTTYQVRCPFCGELHTHGTMNGLRRSSCGRSYLVQPPRLVLLDGAEHVEVGGKLERVARVQRQTMNQGGPVYWVRCCWCSREHRHHTDLGVRVAGCLRGGYAVVPA